MSTSPLITLQPKIPGLFKCFKSVHQLLKANRHIPEVEELLTVWSKQLKSAPTKICPLIVFEGLDGVGKSNHTQLTAYHFRAAAMSTPPSSITHLRGFFDAQEPTLKRAFYSLGNYLAADEIRLILTKKPVILDRFWHSTAAYTLANQSLTPSPEDLQWPTDLIKPDLVLFLHVPEAVRAKRMALRNDMTPDEAKLGKDAIYRRVLTSFFVKMRDPAVVPISTDDDEVDVQRKIKKMIKDLPYFQGTRRNE